MSSKQLPAQHRHPSSSSFGAQQQNRSSTAATQCAGADLTGFQLSLLVHGADSCFQASHCDGVQQQQQQSAGLKILDSSQTR